MGRVVLSCHRGSDLPLNGFDAIISSSSAPNDGRIELRAKVSTGVKWQELVATVYSPLTLELLF